MKRIITFTEYLFESDGGGGVAFATANGNGAGNVVAPGVGSSPGSVWGQGSGTIGSGDVPAYDYGKKFGLSVDKEEKKKGKKKAKKKNNKVPRYFTKEYMRL